MQPPITHEVCQGANRPLMFWGIDRRIWYFAWAVAGIEWEFIALPRAMLVGIVSFMVIWLGSRALMLRDPEFVSLFLALYPPGFMGVFWVTGIAAVFLPRLRPPKFVVYQLEAGRRSRHG